MVSGTLQDLGHHPPGLPSQDPLPRTPTPSTLFPETPLPQDSPPQAFRPQDFFPQESCTGLPLPGQVASSAVSS